ncbi:hypothetical protein Hanom_Chr07g00673931 [Helianthus anomalus]
MSVSVVDGNVYTALGWMRLRLRVEFQWFLIALSVLPCKSFAINAHLFPWIAWALIIILSSASAQHSQAIITLQIKLRVNFRFAPCALVTLTVLPQTFKNSHFTP